MKKFFVKRYSTSEFQIWNNFIAHAKNATFLFHRNFMDYHKDRFEDFSLLILEGEKVVAVMPANISGTKVSSHQGLSYGGLIYDHNLKLAEVIDVFREVLRFLNDFKIQTLCVRTLPFIYNKIPSDEMLYALFLSDATLVNRDTLSVLDLSKRLNLSQLRKRGVRKGVLNHLSVVEKTSFDDFWKMILEPNLKEKFNSKPIHTVDEISLLKSHFPMNIRQFNVYQHDELIGGTTVFVSDQVVHVQYISSKNGESDLGNLDFLFHYLMTNIFPNKKYFDFGTSNGTEDRKLNVGLSNWKESFGASTVAQDLYTVPTVNYKLLLDYAI